MSGILKAKKKPFAVWDAKSIGEEDSKFGLEGSFTQVVRTYSPPPRGECAIIEGENKDTAKSLAGILLKGEALREM